MTDANELGIELKRDFKRKMKRFLLGNFLFKYASGFLTSGIANENFYNNYGVPYKKMMRMPFSWGYDVILDEAKKIEKQRDASREELGICKECFIFLYVGRQSKEKLPFTMIDAYDKVKYKNKKLFFVGDGPLHQEILQYIADKNIKGVEFFGFQRRPHLFKFYNVADALILPSYNEPWGIVVNEAMCFKLPVIASDRVGAALDLIKDEYNGFITPTWDIEKLSICMENIANMSAQERILFGKRSLDAVISWIKKVDPTKRVFKILDLLK